MTTLALTEVTGTTLAAAAGDNTHYDRSGAYQKSNGDADPQALIVTGALGVAVFRERLANNAGQHGAIDGLTGMKVYAHPGDINSTESQIRTLIHAYAVDTGRRSRIAAITGMNEVNNTSSNGPIYNGSGGSGSTHWYDQAVWQQYIIKDQIEIERAAGNFAAGQPKIVGPSLKRAGAGESESQYDADIAALSTATYTTAGVTYHMADLCDDGDVHWYSGWNGPGFRMNGKDSGGSVPAGITLSPTDGKVSQEKYEIQRARQIYDRMLTGGTGALVSGHWKYTGGSVTTGHGATFAMCHSEGGTPIDAESGHSAEEWQAKAAVYVPEMVLRDYSLGCTYSIPYETLTDRGTDGLRLGHYNLTNYPSGALPPYTALKAMLSYNGGQSFATVTSGSFTSAVTGALPDCTPYALSAGSGVFWLYVLKEADTAAYLTLAAGYKVQQNGVDLALRGDGSYQLDLSDSLTVWGVVPNSGGGGAPVWTDVTLANHAVGGSFSASVAATGATSYSIVSGAIPGVTMNTSTGVFSGSPTTSGAYPLVIRATNGSGHVDSPVITVNITSPPVFTADSPPLALTRGVAYSYQYVVTGFPDSTFTLGGTAIAGMTMSTDGTYSGVPTAAAGNYTNHAAASNSLAGSTNGGNHTFVVSGAGGGGTIPVWDADISLPAGVVGAKYGPDRDGDGIGDGVDLSQYVSSGSEDCSYTTGSGNIPLGMVLSGSGKLRNTPNVPGDYSFTVLATDSAGTTESPVLTIGVVDNGNHGDGQSITYLLQGPNSSCMHYIQFQASTMGDRDSARFDQLQDVNGQAIFVVRAKSSGKIDIDDKDGNSLAKGESFFALFSTDPSARWRASYVVGYDGTTARLIMRCYGDLESEQYSDILVASVASTSAPYQMEIGNKTGEVYMTTDTWTTSPLPQEIPPADPKAGGSLTPLFPLAGPGAVTSTSIRIHGRFTLANATKTANLAYATTPEMTSATNVGAVTLDADAIARWTVSGLTANTRYYFRFVDPATGSYLGEQASYPTLPSTSGAWSLRIANMSCLNNPQQGQIPQHAIQDAVSWAPHITMHSGDMGYWGQTISAADSYTKDLQKYDKALSLVPSYRQLFANSLLVATISDHELHVNGDDWGGQAAGQPTEDPTGAFNCPHSVRQMTAHTALFPVVSYGDSRVPKRHRGYSFDIGSQVRVIVTDFRTPDRSNASDPDAGDATSTVKQMWGAVQEAWIFATLDATKVNLIVNETSWWTNTGALRASDKPAAYPDAQARFVDKLNGTGAFAGGPVYKAAWIGGDRHYSGWFSAADSDLTRPQYIGSGLLKNGLQLQEGETPTWAGEFLPDNTIDKFNVCQYQQLTLSFDGANTVTITANNRQAGTTLSLTDGVCTSGLTAVSSSAGLFLPSHEGQLIAGDGIRNTLNGKDAPTYFHYLTATTGTLSQAATSTQAAGSWTLQNAVSEWRMSDYPGGSITTDTWTV